VEYALIGETKSFTKMWQANMKTEVGFYERIVVWIRLTRKRIQRQTFVKAIMDLMVP